MRYYEFDNIPLYNFVEATKGNLTKIVKRRWLPNRFLKKSKMLNKWYEIQDDYIAFFGGEGTDARKYRKVLIRLNKLICRYILEEDNKLMNEINKAYNVKIELQKKLVSENNVKFEDLSGMVSVSVGFLIEPKKILAKDFFNIAKNLEKNGKENIKG